MTKWSGGSERMRLIALIVEVICGVSNRLCDLHLPQSSPGFFIQMLSRHDRAEGVRDTLAGR